VARRIYHHLPEQRRRQDLREPTHATRQPGCGSVEWSR
jgi:hypothetical protein